MRGLISVAVVLAIVVGFFAVMAVLPRVRTGHERVTLVTGVVEATEEQLASGEVTVFVGLYDGAPRTLQIGDVPIDSIGPVPPERSEFALAAGPDDGASFFVHASVELESFEAFCAVIALPPVRLVDEDGDETWVEARTGRPPAPLRITATEPC